MALATCRYCGTPVTDAPACVNCGALIAPQRLRESLPALPTSLRRPGRWNLALLITLGAAAIALNVLAVAWVIRLWAGGRR